MNSDIKLECERIVGRIQSPKFRGNLGVENMAELMDDCQVVRAYLQEPAVAIEMDYRRVKAQFLDKNSVAKAEALAKATQEYADHIYVQGVLNLLHEQVLVAKKIIDMRSKEMMGY